MCNIKVLHHNEHGHVVQCANCRQLQIGYGNTIISMGINEFQKFRKVISESCKDSKDSLSPQVSNITIHTPSQQIKLVFSVQELELLHDLIGQAGIMMEVNSILSFN